jgi:hypothetical protein
MGRLTAAYPALLQHGPDFGLPAQTLSGTIVGGSGGPYTVRIHVIDPVNGETVYTISTSVSFVLTATPGDPYFGCGTSGLWEAWFEVQGPSDWYATTPIYWSVSFPTVHGVP